MEKLTDEQRKEVIEKMLERGKSRSETIGRKFSEADFVAGAGAAFEALGLWNQFPANWIINVMTGRKIFKGDK